MTTEWKNAFGGRSWRLTPQGIEAEEVGFLRSRGNPVTVTQIWEDFGPHIIYVSNALQVPADMIVAMIPIEAVRGKDGRFNPKSNRFEPGYKTDEETPHRRSPGLMQTLISTARAMAKKYQLIDEAQVTTDLLYDPFYSILLGGAYIKHQCDIYGYDPVLICGAYNAGKVRRSPDTPWRILTYGKTRLDRYVAFFNDFHEALRLGLIQLPDGGLVLSLPQEPKEES
jgi:hypothetical protein